MSTIAIIAGTAAIAAPVGFLVCAVMTAGKVGDLSEATRQSQDDAATQKAIAKLNGAASRINADKIDAIRDLLNTPRTIRKGELAAVLDGDV